MTAAMANQPGAPQVVSVPPTVPGQATAAQIIFIQAGHTGPRVYENYASQTSKFLGVGRVVIGALCIVLQIATIVTEMHQNYMAFSPVGTGIWCGIFVSNSNEV